MTFRENTNGQEDVHSQSQAWFFQRVSAALHASYVFPKAQVPKGQAYRTCRSLPWSGPCGVQAHWESAETCQDKSSCLLAAAACGRQADWSSSSAERRDIQLGYELCGGSWREELGLIHYPGILHIFMSKLHYWWTFYISPKISRIYEPNKMFYS